MRLQTVLSCVDGDQSRRRRSRSDVVDRDDVDVARPEHRQSADNQLRHVGRHSTRFELVVVSAAVRDAGVARCPTSRTAGVVVV